MMEACPARKNVVSWSLVMIVSKSHLSPPVAQWLRVILLLGILTSPVLADWRLLSPFDQRQARPPKKVDGGTPIKTGDRWPNEQKFRWVIGDLEIPELVGKEPASGKTVGLQINGGDGGEVFIGDELQTRFDNDHPGLVVVAEKAVP